MTRVMLSRSEHNAGMARYIDAGVARAAEIGNRGPVRFDAHGRLHPEILSAFRTHGYYIFEGVLDESEIAELRAGADELIERAPIRPDAATDAQGRPALGRNFAKEPYVFIKPLSDPWGGTEALGGRHPTQMTQPAPDADAPEHVVFLIRGICQSMEAGLRLYGHPQLLAIAETINGEDFVPFNDSIFVKQAGVGGSVSWHQDGVTHWDAANWDEGIHGFNFQAQLYTCTPENCLWVMPGTHKKGRVDIKAMVAANGGSEQLPGAVPLECRPGDVTIVNRQLLHGSFANSSPDQRLSITFGFHRRAAVLGQKAVLSAESEGVYDAQRIFKRSAVIAVAIDARHKHRLHETPFAYKPFTGREDEFRFNEDTVNAVIKDYNVNDLAI